MKVKATTTHRLSVAQKIALKCLNTILNAAKNSDEINFWCRRYQSYLPPFEVQSEASE